jgi:hypothetical protein
VGGHGRVLACEWLAQQPNKWFDEQWAQWEKVHGSQYFNDELPEIQRRYRSGYWTSVPVQIVSLSKKQHRTALLTLNHRTGQDDDSEIAKMLAKLSPIDSADAGFDEAQKSEFLARFSPDASANETSYYDEIAENLNRKLSPAMYEPEPDDISGDGDFDDSSHPNDSSEYGFGDDDSSYGDSSNNYDDYDPSDYDPVDDENEIVVPQGGLNHNADPDEPVPSLYPLSIVLKGDDLAWFEDAKANAKINTDKIFLLRFHPAFNG